MTCRHRLFSLASVAALTWAALHSSSVARGGEPYAGNVTAQLVDPFDEGIPTVLAIEGDNAANGVCVVELQQGYFCIKGVGSTTVNGVAEDHLVAPLGFILMADVRLGNGGDTLVYEFAGVQTPPYGTYIDTGTDDDSVSVSLRGAVGFLRIDTGVGNDDVTICRASADASLHDLAVNTGLGDDTVLVWSVVDTELPLLGVWGGIVETEQGNDAVQFEGSFVIKYGTLLVLLGVGDDTLVGDVDTGPVDRVEGIGGSGYDTVLNAAYFQIPVRHFEATN